MTDPSLPSSGLFPPGAWRPLPRPAGEAESVVIARADEPASTDTGAESRSAHCHHEGPEVLACDEGEGTARVRFRHHAPAAHAVALQANGWWRPDPVDACDLRPTGKGWWEATFEVPADWRATYGYVEHLEDGDPPWWESGLKNPGAPVTVDVSNPQRHRAARGGGLRAVVSVPDDGPFGPERGRDREPSPIIHTLATSPGEPITRWWASHPTDPGCEGLPGHATLPLLIVTDGLQHVDQLSTPARLRRGVAEGVLPPLAAVFIESGPQRGEVLGIPGGHARWIAETLVPRLAAEGLDGRITVADVPSRTIITGSSFGGLTALFALAQAPQLIGAAIAQSVSLWRYPHGALVEPLLRACTDQSVRLRLHAGRYEGTMPALARELTSELTAGGLDDVQLSIHSGGHDWAWWQPVMLQELAALLR